MADPQNAILGLKRELKNVRAKMREHGERADAWRRVADTLRALAGLDDEKYKNLLRSVSLPCD
jgi:hypothetical protein